MEINSKIFDTQKYNTKYPLSFCGNPINKITEELSEEAIKRASDAATSIGKAGIDIVAQRAKIKTIKPEDITSRLEAGLNRKEICEEFGISPSTYNRLLIRFNIVSDSKQTMQFTQNLTKEQLEEILSQDKTLDEIAKELGVSKATLHYQRKRLGIASELSEQKNKIKTITKEDILKYLSENKTRAEICEILNISETTYTKLLNKYNIVTAQKIATEHSKSISKEKLISMLDAKIPIMKICEELGISWSTFKKLTTEYGIQTKQMQTQARNATITMEQLTQLIEQGLSRDEICKRLGINRHTYNSKLNEFGIKSRLSLNKEKVASITQEQLEQLMSKAKSVKEICKELDISTGTYSRLLHKFNIQGKRTSKISDETAKQFKELIEQNKSKEEICNQLHINTNTYFMICHELGIKTAAKQMEEHASTIDKENIISCLNQNMSVNEILETLSISKAVLRRLLIKFDIKTSWKAAREKVANVDEEKLKNLVEQGKSQTEITEALNISKGTYMNLLRKFNISTSYKESGKKISGITKEAITQKLLENKSYADIAKEFGIAPSSVYRLILKYDLPSKVGKTAGHKELWGTPKPYEKYSISELKERLLEVFLENPNIAKQKDIEFFTDYIYETDTFTPELQNQVVEFIRLLDSAESKRIYAKDIINHQVIEKLELSLEQISKDIIIKEHSMNYTNEIVETLLNKLYQGNMPELAQICLKFKSKSVNEFDEQLAQKITSRIKTVLGEEGNIKADRLRHLVYEIIYTEKLHSAPASETIIKAQKYAANNKGEISPSKAGQYIINAERLENYFKTSDSSPYNQEYFKLIKNTLQKDSNESVITLTKLDSWFNSEFPKDNHLTEFLKIFDKENPIDNSIIKKFILDTYQKIDTCTVFETQSGAIIRPKILSSVKKDIIEKYKYPNCIEYLAAFEDGIKRFAPPKGQSGIKIETTGLKRMKVKIIGYPDRLYSSKKDYVFDKYDPDHRANYNPTTNKHN